jgi:poly(3-hydroxybutyrate) depolymerase
MRLVGILAALVGCHSTSANGVDARTGIDASHDGPIPQCPTATLAPMCDGEHGAEAPMMVCSPDQPCTMAGNQIGTTPIDRPTCTAKTGGPVDPLMSWTDANGDMRFACAYTPRDAITTPRPLLLFFHGATGAADNLYDLTGLRDQAVTGNLGDAPGFVVASMQARYLHWYGSAKPGTFEDIFYRDFGTDSCNPDIRSADHLIDTLVAAGGVDPGRIYVAGWSNGGFFAQMYAIARFTTPTPGGHRVAAAVAYAGSDPYTNVSAGQVPTCAEATYPTSTVPIYNIHRACDSIIVCDAAHDTTHSGIDVETWIGRAHQQVADPGVVDVIIDADAQEVTGCAATCGDVEGALNHIRWPDGRGQSGSIDWEPAMLTFLRDHPHP